MKPSHPRTTALVFALSAAVCCASPHTSAHPGHQDAADTASADAVARPRVSITQADGYRYIAANGLPDHATGRFPNRHNPHRIAEQNYRFRVPLGPVANDEPTSARGMPFGVALNGVVFDPGTAENWTAQGLRRGGPPTDWTYEALGGAVHLGVDASHAHVQPTGAYHYHGIPTALLERQARLQRRRGPVLLGYAADGFPIYGPHGYADPMDPDSELVLLQPSYTLRPGERPGPRDQPPGPGGKHDGAFVQDWQYTPGHGDLDRCNGRFGATPEYPEGTYHYVLTEAYPFIPRDFRGTPDDSFQRRGPGNRRGNVNEREDRRQDRRRPPPPPR